MFCVRSELLVEARNADAVVDVKRCWMTGCQRNAHIARLALFRKE
jgi:hypothetical protein